MLSAKANAMPRNGIEMMSPFASRFSSVFTLHYSPFRTRNKEVVITRSKISNFRLFNFYFLLSKFQLENHLG